MLWRNYWKGLLNLEYQHGGNGFLHVYWNIFIDRRNVQSVKPLMLQIWTTKHSKLIIKNSYRQCLPSIPCKKELPWLEYPPWFLGERRKAPTKCGSSDAIVVGHPAVNILKTDSQFNQPSLNRASSRSSLAGKPVIQGQWTLTQLEQ